MASSQKKQQTLSSFFKRPLVTSSNSNAGPQPAETKSSIVSDFEFPDPKRRRISTEDKEKVFHSASDPTLRLSDSDDDDGPVSRIRPQNDDRRKPQPSTSKSPHPDRTSKYLFSSSPVQEIQNEGRSDPYEQQRKDELHRRFVKKLGKPDSIAEIKRRNRALLEDGTEEQENEEGEDEGLPEPQKPASRGAKKAAGNKLTPMEKQVLEIKRSNMDTVLVVEVGYKFRFFGEDARVAARELSIVCIPGKLRYDEHPSEAHLDRFASASIPVHRLHVHVKRLVSAGHKVGVVRQLETAALKAVGDNRNTPFVRKLTNLYTKGTYIDEIEGLEEDSGSSSSQQAQSPSTGYLLCLTEVNVKGYGNDEKVHVGMIAVQPATGDIIYDDFEDGFMRSEIETRLLHIAPCEFLIVGDLSKATDKMVMHLSGTKMNVFGDKARIERVSKYKTMAAEAHSHISSFYADKVKESGETDVHQSKMLEKILGLPENVIISLSAMIKHMAEYGLEHVFDLTKYFQSFSARSHMMLNGNTLSSLEIYQNQTDYTVKGSLFWTLDRSHTKFGARLLRKWVGRPLLNKTLIEERLFAIEELLSSKNTFFVEKLRAVLMKIRTDLEKSLIRIYYGKCTRPELLNVLQSLQFLATEFAHVSNAESTGFQSPLLTSALLSLPTILTEVVGYLDKINLQAAKSDDKYEFFREDQETDDITEHKLAIAVIEDDLNTFRTTAAEKLGRKLPVQYAAVAGIDYLIEIDNASASIKKVPASWIKISGTKKLSRFHPPEVVTLIKERDQHKEALAAACDAAFTNLLLEISAKYQLFRDTVQSLATLDCLLSLATVASQPGYVRPTFSDDIRVEVNGARHPMIEQLLLDSYVPNDISLAADSTRALLVTGPNMGGKSSYVRSVALIAIMAQIGCYVPADSAKLGIFDAVFTRMGAFDNMMSGESTFMVELSETSDILKLATERSLVILDELGRGTSTHDGVAIAGSVLDWLVREKKSMTLFITHYQVLARMADAWPNGELKNVHMRFTEDETGENVTFLYEVGEGVAHRSYGLNVARLANIGERAIELAKEKSLELEGVMKKRNISSVARLLLRDNGGNGKATEMEETGTGDNQGDGELSRIVEAIELL